MAGSRRTTPAFALRRSAFGRTALQTPNAKHRARQVRARIVALAQEYREAGRQYEEISAYVMSLLTPPDIMRAEEQRTWEGREQRRAALFGALEELEMLEEG